MDNLIGTTINHYQILVKIRETPTRILFKVYNTKAHGYAALEVVKLSHGDQSELLGLINAQAQKNGDLLHPSISVVNDSGIHEGIMYIVYNFVPAHPLRRFFNRTYSWQEMAREIVPITHALAYAHEKGVIHGCLNPTSIILDDKKNPILFDFGFEKIISDYILAHSPGAWINRWGFEYQSPEQLNGAAIDARSDIYSVGMILHEWLMGRVAYLDSTPLDTLRIRKKKIKAKKDKKAITPITQNLIDKCITPDPANRYQSMQELYIVLARGALDMTITKSMVRKPLAITVRRFNLQRSLIGLGIVVALGASGFFLINKTALRAAATTESTSPTPAPATPTRIPLKPTATRTVIAPTPTFVLQAPNTIDFPIYQGDSLSSAVNQLIAPENAKRMVMVSYWGIGDVDRLAASGDGRYIAIASSIGISVFDAQTLELEKYIDTRSWITTLVFSPDGKTIASGDRDGLIQLWDTTTWLEAKAPFSGHTKAIRDLAFSPDGSKLASVAYDNTLIEWQVAAEDNQKIRRDVTDVTSVIYSADNKSVITGGDDFKINVWNVNDLTLQQTRTLQGKAVDLASGTGILVVGDTNQAVSILDLNDPSTDTTLGSMKYTLTSVTVSPKGDLIAGGDINGGVTVWKKDGTLLRETQNYVHTDPNISKNLGIPHSIAFNSDGTALFSGLHNGIIRKLNSSTLEEIKINRSLDAHSSRLAISHNGKYAIIQHEDNLLTLWDIWNTQPLYDHDIPGEIKDGNPFSLDDSMIAVALDGKTVAIYKTSDGVPIYKFNNQQGLQVIEFVVQDAQLATGNDQDMHLWSISSGQELIIKKNFKGQGCATIFDLKDNPIFSITNFQHIVSSDQNLDVLCRFQKLDWTIDINETSGLVVFGGGSKLTVRNTRQQSVPDREFNVNFKKIINVAISPSGALLAAAYDDNTIHIWNIATLEELFSLYGHNDRITDLQFTSDGKLLLSTSLDGTIRVWGAP